MAEPMAKYTRATLGLPELPPRMGGLSDEAAGIRKRILAATADDVGRVLSSTTAAVPAPPASGVLRGAARTLGRAAGPLAVVSELAFPREANAGEDAMLAAALQKSAAPAPVSTPAAGGDMELVYGNEPPTTAGGVPQPTKFLQPAGISAPTPLFTNRPELLGDAGIATGIGGIAGNTSLQDARNALSAPIAGPMQGARGVAGQPGIFTIGPGTAPVEAAPTTALGLRPTTPAAPVDNGIRPGFGRGSRGMSPEEAVGVLVLADRERADLQRGFRNRLLESADAREERELALQEAELPSILGLRQAQGRQADAQAQQSLAKAEGAPAEEQPFEFRQPSVDRFTGEATPGKIKIGKTEYDVTAEQMTTISPIAQQRAAGLIAEYQAKFNRAPSLRERLAIINAAHAEAWSQLYAPKAEVK